ncbi:hypothetical protein F2P81_013246 [Scophthalmus maximus]|uniref:Uncharacterized protein n=1 Tax=Scophthalmus maximus TaxID=52904 RepID=A0A6A4STQ3_SCOMX|nr:hypothetical protein F2P81_013246 [Scophthalmus maximus]
MKNNNRWQQLSITIGAVVTIVDNESVDRRERNGPIRNAPHFRPSLQSQQRNVATSPVDVVWILSGEIIYL